MKRSMSTLIAIMALGACLLPACSTGSSIVTASPEEIRNTGANMTGRDDISADRWMEIAEVACEGGAWDWDVAADVFEEEIVTLHPNATPGSGPQAVWLLLTTACYDAIPAEAIERGPPPVPQG